MNGSQSSLGPKWQVDVEAGTHNHPYSQQGQTGNAIFKRVQVHDADLDPALNPGATYYVESQYVAFDDGNKFNNNSYRTLNKSGSNGFYTLSPTGSTTQQLPAIFAWQDADPLVEIKVVDHRYYAGVRVTDLGGDRWHYEYAIENLLDTHGTQSLRIPIPHGATISNIGFHDVDYHSGEPQGGADWTVTIDTASSPNTIRWSSETFAENSNVGPARRSPRIRTAMH